MQQLPSTFDVQVLLLEAKAATRRLGRTCRGPYRDRDDLQQELLADALKRIPAFDADRGALGAFVGTLMANKATRIAHAVRSERRLFGEPPVSIDDPVGEDQDLSLGDTISEGEGYGAMFGQKTDAFLEADRRLDLDHGLTVLSTTDRDICKALSRSSIEELVQQGKGSRSGLYRRVGRIRLDLMAAGLDGGAS